MCKVSVIMPVYNAEKYVKQTVESILNQSYQDFELVVVDDCSTDKSMQIIKELNDKRIKIYSNEKNKGIAYTRNRALELANGEYIAIMDDDDIAPVYRLEEEADFLSKHLEYDVVAGNTYIIDENGTVKGMFERVLRNPDIIRGTLIFQNIYGNSTAMFRKEFIEKYDIRYRENMCGAEDYMFWGECSLHGRITAMDKVMMCWRKHQKNQTNKMKNENIEKRKSAISSIQKYLLDNNGFRLSKSKYEDFFRFFSEDGELRNKEDIKLLYEILDELVMQARRKKMEFCEEFSVVCRKQFGKKCGKAFFLWEK